MKYVQLLQEPGKRIYNEVSFHIHQMGEILNSEKTDSERVRRKDVLFIPGGNKSR